MTTKSETELATRASLKVSLTASTNTGTAKTQRSRIPRSPSPKYKMSVKTANVTAAKSNPEKVRVASSTGLVEKTQAEKNPSSKSTNSDQKTPKGHSRQTAAHEHPNYIACHLGEPCSLQSLDHLLTCGHKVLTYTPENCASNCQHPSNLKHANPRSIDQPFVCMACIIEDIKQRRIEKLSAFSATMESVANVIDKADAKRWIEEKVAVMEMGWREIEIEQVVSQSAQGRACQAFYIDQGFVELVGAATKTKNWQGIKTDTSPAPKLAEHSTMNSTSVTAKNESKVSPKLISRLPTPQTRS